ncbi:glutamate--cysteine ligase [Haloplasma contractile]|uniref:Glutamate--cysteine ligase n=1 Tax=Haloplasma contractile SSD-17B TaxID=1033810 RepID=U2FFD1_9MOLU|nr:glutamate-cysteine ligase family protein [Haloplasma contractile]ERJ11625.1 glutamate--cysteine ligase protein [Haloplasma contractile SSD-17B]
MNYTEQINEISNYFRQNEKKHNNVKIGVEFEYFIIDKNTLKTISYYGKNGVHDTLKKLTLKGYKGSYEGEHILGLIKDYICVTLEPGCQFEISIGPLPEIKEIEAQYLSFLDDLIPLLEQNNQALIACGYQPQSTISDIKMIPKKRYDYMFEYFKSCGSLAHNMMKGTASVQYSFDYESEKDYIKKFKVSNALSPVLYAIFDNSPIFEGEVYQKHSLRTNIWSNCDLDRCGIVDGALSAEFNYDSYSQYILTRSPIFIPKGDIIQDVKDSTYRDLFNPNQYNTEDLEHILTMSFPDVRTKKFIEIRMIDSLPYPLNFSALALLKGIIYNKTNLNKVYDFIQGITTDAITDAKQEIIDHGIHTRYHGKPIIEIANWLLKLALDGLESDEVGYLMPLQDILMQCKTPSTITKERLQMGMNKIDALSFCIVTNTNQTRGERNECRTNNRRVCQCH